MFDVYDVWMIGFLCALIGFVAGLLTFALVKHTDFNDWGEDEHADPNNTGQAWHDFASRSHGVPKDLPDYLKRQAD